MLHLIKLELKKGRMTGYLWGSLIAYGVIAAFFLLIYLAEGPNKVEPAFESFADMFFIVDTLTRATFIIYASVLLSKLVISEYRDKTMALLFAYPVSRTKLIFAKLSMVFVWAFTNIVMANLLIGALLVAVDSQFGYVQESLTAETLSRHALNVLTQAIGAAGMSLLPLAFGMRKKSVSATVASSILIVAIVCSNNMGFSLSSIIAIPLSLGALGIVLTYLSFRNVDRTDAA